MGMSGKLDIRGFFTTFTGMHIGRDGQNGNNDHIPKIILKNPIDMSPFVPGSAIKGTVRRLMGEYGWGVEGVFESRHNCQITFCDATLCEESKKMLLQQTDCYLSEVKIHSSIDRITSQGTFYALEQIPAGVYFTFRVIFTAYSHTEITTFMHLLSGLQLLEDMFLGAHVSRGLGNIKFGKWSIEDNECLDNSGLEVIWYPLSYYQENTGAKVIVNPSENTQFSQLIEQRQIFQFLEK